MRLTINGEPVRFSLEHERTLGEVAAAAERWLAGAGFVTIALSADGEDLAGIPRERWGARPLDGVEELAIGARLTGELHLEGWRAAARVLETLSAVLDDGGAGAAASAVDAGEAFDAASEAIAVLRASPAGPDAAAAAARLETALADAAGDAAGAAARAWPANRRAEVAAIARELSTTLATLVATAADPVRAVAEAAEPVARLVPALGEVAVQLQTGRDREAMATVTDLSDAIQRLVPLVSLLPPDGERERLIVDLNATLRGLAAALEAKDTVLIGDLAEYEVAPRLTALLPLLGRLP